MGQGRCVRASCFLLLYSDSAQMQKSDSHQLQTTQKYKMAKDKQITEKAHIFSVTLTLALPFNVRLHVHSKSVALCTRFEIAVKYCLPAHKVPIQAEKSKSTVVVLLL